MTAKFKMAGSCDENSVDGLTSGPESSCNSSTISHRGRAKIPQATQRKRQGSPNDSDSALRYWTKT
jgi:hypothetical protein